MWEITCTDFSTALEKQMRSTREVGLIEPKIILSSEEAFGATEATL